MNTFTTSHITLTAAINAFLSGRGNFVKNLRQAPTFADIQAFMVGRPKNPAQATGAFDIEYDSTAAWLGSLAARGAMRAYLRRSPMLQTSVKITPNVTALNFAAAQNPQLSPPGPLNSAPAELGLNAYVPTNATWFIQIIFASSYELWSVHIADFRIEKRVLMFRSSQAKQRCFLLLRTHCIAQPQEPLVYDIEETKLRLIAALKAIALFAQKFQLDHWRQTFEDALTFILSPKPLSLLKSHGIVATSSFPLTALQLIVAAQKAWVFGGMGSWNDQSFEILESQPFKQVSAQLHNAITDAFEAGTNAFILPHSLKANTRMDDRVY